jgi:hypothetical protein
MVTLADRLLASLCERNCGNEGKKNRVSKSEDDRETRGIFRISTTEALGEHPAPAVQGQNRKSVGLQRTSRIVARNSRTIDHEPRPVSSGNKAGDLLRVHVASTSPHAAASLRLTARQVFSG